MRFLGFNFIGVDFPANLTYTPPGWDTSLGVTAARSTAQARSRLVPGDAPVVKQLTPVALESNAVQGLPTLPCSQVITALVSAAGPGGPTKTTTATELPDVLTQRADVLTSVNGMDEVLCAGFMIATFDYQFEPAPTQPPVHADDFEAIRKASAQDVVVGTAFNLAKKKEGNGSRTTVLHNKNNNLDQVHTEQLLCGQISAFMKLLSDNGANAEVINIHDRWVFKKDGFDMKKLTVKVKIVFEHQQNNVKTDCAACSKTIRETTEKWAPKCRSFSITVSKNS